MADRPTSLEALTLEEEKVSLLNGCKVVLLPTHLDGDQIHNLESQVQAHGGVIVQDIFAAKVILTAISSPRRVRFECQVRGVDASSFDSDAHSSPLPTENNPFTSKLPPRKRRKLATQLSSYTSASQSPELPGECADCSVANADNARQDSGEHEGGSVVILKVDWLKESIKSGQLLPFRGFSLLQGDVTRATTHTPKQKAAPALVTRSDNEASEDEVAATPEDVPRRSRSLGKPRRAAISSTSIDTTSKKSTAAPPHASLTRETTMTEDGRDSQLLDMPFWVTEHKLYACERPTPPDSPNSGFLDQLRRIRLIRTLTLDEVGVRAYSTSIAAIAAFPRPFSRSAEVAALPGCNEKIARLFREFQAKGYLDVVEESRTDPALSTIEEFYNVWGVGATTARKWYFDKGWRSLDDVIEQGWEGLLREQKLGLKFREEFAQLILRSEVEYIASIVLYHARKLVDEGVECVIVGGYRRGKKESGDVDLMLSHRREDATAHLVGPLVDALETSGWVTHLLDMSQGNSRRGQDGRPLKRHRGLRKGLDGLDKALCVWQDPTWDSRKADLSDGQEPRNPNPHRRVDIIITPWHTVGCAVAGWTSGTTFQRDLRRYARKVKGWKFDSSGVRDNTTGQWIDLELWADEKTRAKTWQEAERRVFESFGLPWLEPWERCTD